MSSSGARKLDYQNPLKEKLTKEINLRCEEKIRHKAKVNSKLARLTRNVIKHNTVHPQHVKGYDYYTSTWDKLIHKTKDNNEILRKGEYRRSKERDREDSQTRRTIDPSFVASPKAATYDVYYQQPQTVKHVSSKTVGFKPPLPPRDANSHCER